MVDKSFRLYQKISHEVFYCRSFCLKCAYRKNTVIALANLTSCIMETLCYNCNYKFGIIGNLKKIE